MPALFPILAIVAVFVFITAHSLTHPPSKHTPYRNQTTASGQSYWKEFLIALKAVGVAIPLVFNLDKSKRRKDNQETNDAKNDSSVVEVFEFSINKGIIKLAIAYLGLLTINLLSSVAISWTLLMLPLVPIAAFVAIRILTSYRIRSEFYGNNRYEAIKLIKFIEQNSNDRNFPGGPGKKVFLSREARKKRSFHRLEGEGGAV